MSDKEIESVESGPGALLKEVRKQQGLSIKDVASKLKLMEQSIRNIEEDDYKDIPLTFYKGYLKNYAQLLGLNPTKTYETFSRYLESKGLESDSRLTPAYKDERISQKKIRQYSNIFTKVISFLIVLAIVYSIYYLLIEKNYWNKFIDSFNKESVQQEQSINTQLDESEGELIPIEDTTPQTVDTVALPINEENLSDIPVTTSLNDNGSDLQGELDIASSAAVSEIAPTVNSNALILSFSGDCWVQVVDATGRVLISRMKSDGDVSELIGQAPYQLTIGKITNISIQFQGEAVDLSSYSEGRIAKLTLGG